MVELLNCVTGAETAPGPLVAPRVAKKFERVNCGMVGSEMLSMLTVNTSPGCTWEPEVMAAPDALKTGPIEGGSVSIFIAICGMVAVGPMGPPGGETNCTICGPKPRPLGTVA